MVPPLGKFSSLDSLEMKQLEDSVNREAVDLNILHSVLETWTSSTLDRQLSVRIHAQPRQRIRDNILEFMQKVGDIVEEYFSGVHTLLIYSHHK